MQQQTNKAKPNSHPDKNEQELGTFFPFLVLVSVIYFIYKSHTKLQQMLASYDLSEKHALWASLAGYALLFLCIYGAYKFLKSTTGKKTTLFAKQVTYVIIFSVIAYYALLWAVPSITPLHKYIFTAFFALMVASSEYGKKVGGFMVAIMLLDGLFNLQIVSSLFDLLP